MLILFIFYIFFFVVNNQHQPIDDVRQEGATTLQQRLVVQIEKFMQLKEVKAKG